MRRNSGITILTIASLFLVSSCGSKASGEDGTVKHCSMMQEKDPEQTLGGKSECECVAKKLKGFLTEEHYSIFNDYNAASVEIALALPDLRAPEMNARILKSIALKREQSPSTIVSQMSEFGSVTMQAYKRCGVIPEQ